MKLVVLAFGISVAVGACSACSNQASDEVGYTAKPRPPYTSNSYSSTRLILRRSASGFEVVSSTPSHGGVTRPNVDESLPEILEGKSRLYEYTVRGLDGVLVAQGWFVAPLEARATFGEDDDPGRVHHAELPDPNPLVRVAVPFVPQGATVELQSLRPDPSRAYTEWAKDGAGSIRIEPAAVEPAPRDASP